MKRVKGSIDGMIKIIEYWWRHHIVYPLLRMIFRNPEITTPIDIHSIHSILILRYDRIGDMIVTTSIFKSLKQAHPHIKIGILASRANAEIVRHNAFVDQVHILPKHWWQLLRLICDARKEQYDVVLNLVFNRTTSGGLLSNLIAPKGIKVGQGDEKYKMFFNVMLTLNRQSSHMVDTLVSILKTIFDMPVDANRLQYEIAIDGESRRVVDDYLLRHNLQSRGRSVEHAVPYILFNLSAHDEVRRISQEQAYSIGEYLGSLVGIQTILLHAPNDMAMMRIKQNLVNHTRCFPFPEKGTASLLELAAVIEGAALVITPDTSIVHFASASHTPIIGLYTSMQDTHEWIPFRVQHKILLSDNNQPTSMIDIPQTLKEIHDFMLSLPTIAHLLTHEHSTTKHTNSVYR
jgi:ADP-heptose:LPS heptosyltransferase